MSTLRIGLYPGTFDPITHGHNDVIRRALALVDRLVVAVASNSGKNPMFSLEERVHQVQTEMIRQNIDDKIEVRSFDTLLVNFAEEVEARIIVRGLRAVSDFEYEFQMAGMNARLNQKVETVFLMASESNQFISSRFVKEIGKLGGDISHFTSPAIVKAVAARAYATIK